MIYIIANRLSAQSVEVRKSQLILNDLTVNMFSEGFCTELFRPQPLYSLGATLSIFSSLSETSMMKLASNSIQKLFDLMRMSVKRQLQSLAHPLEIIEWTLNHVEGVQQFVPQQTQPTLIQLRERLLALHRTLNVGDYHWIRRALLNFTAGFRVKVSLFLNNRLQDTEGMFLYPPPSYLVPLPSCEAPGTVRRYSDGKVVETTTVPHRDASLRYPPHVAPGTWDCTQRKCRVTSAGVNVFAHGDDVLRMQSQEIVPGKAHVTAEEQAKEATRGYELEMNYLSQLAGKRHPSAHEKIHLTLFEEESNGTKPSPRRQRS
ncbi:protein OSCP1 [Angomonas deanei]|uniref:Organic solute transport protein 1, putative n=1 Tax=Angomonas deanei TaxID=59799 RepID=A0A7G2CPA4_9TRYP|nr:protein OSCP1 [Angomonas deanei]CAD2221620.1 Organic solute transport protein 1, putative [Angomonas deanei]|eukprot:EPY33936.1 protein OSCP1 [Angomonas deanei]